MKKNINIKFINEYLCFCLKNEEKIIFKEKQALIKPLPGLINKLTSF